MPVRNAKKEAVKETATETKTKSKMSKATEKAKAETPAQDAVEKKSALRKKVEGFFEKNNHTENVDEYAERAIKLDGATVQAAFITFKDGKTGAAMALYDMVQGNDLNGYSVEVAKDADVLIIYKG
jgi:hypothetical protein